MVDWKDKLEREGNSRRIRGEYVGRFEEVVSFFSQSSHYSTLLGLLTSEQSLSKPGEAIDQLRELGMQKKLIEVEKGEEKREANAAREVMSNSRLQRPPLNLTIRIQTCSEFQFYS